MATDGNTAKSKLETALGSIWERSRFTSYFYQSVDLVEIQEIPTIALVLSKSRLVLYYATSFINDRSSEEIIGLLVHEMLHIVMNHNHRAFPDEDIYLQNLAQDMVINSYLDQCRDTFFSRKGQYAEDVAELVLPSGLPSVPQTYIEETAQADPPWEALYRWLKCLPANELQEIRQDFDSANHSPSLPVDSEQQAMHHLNDVLRNPLNIPDEFRSDETYVLLGDQKGLTFNDSKGRQLPTGVHMMMPQESLQQIRAKKEGIIRLSSGDPRCLQERAFQKVRGIISKVQEQDTSPWTHKIRSVIDYASQSADWKYTHGRFNRRYFAQGIYASGRVFEEKGRITVAVDVSGSVIMQPDMLEAVFGVVDDLTRKYIVHLVCIDEQLFIPEKTDKQWIRSGKTDRSYVYQRGDWRFIKTGTMGTTFFSPLFNDYMKQHREMLLVITDGQIFDLDKLVPYRPTLWIVPADQRHRFAVPFGQVVSLRIG